MQNIINIEYFIFSNYILPFSCFFSFRQTRGCKAFRKTSSTLQNLIAQVTFVLQTLAFFCIMILQSIATAPIKTS